MKSRTSSMVADLRSRSSACGRPLEVLLGRRPLGEGDSTWPFYTDVAAILELGGVIHARGAFWVVVVGQAFSATAF